MIPGDVAVDPSVEVWNPARLIPTSGVGGPKEQEKRATSALLAVMHGIPEFGRSVLAYIGAPGGRISTFLEVRLTDGNETRCIPDGAIVVERGARRWRALVEVKTGKAKLGPDQVATYLTAAREHGFDAVVTISNEIVSSPDESPVFVPARLTRRVDLRHISWWRILTMAVMEQEHVADPNRAWVLNELIAYIDHESSGASGFEDMGDSWVSVRDAARQGTLRASDPGARAVAEAWDQFTQYLCLGLRQDLGREVRADFGRRSDRTTRLDSFIRALAQDGKLEAKVRVPDAVAPMEIDVDLRSRLVTTAVQLRAPSDGRPKTRITWLLRQLKGVPDNDLRVEVSFANTRETTTLPLADAIENPERLLSPTDRRREPKRFRVSAAREMGLKRGKGPGSFVYATRRQTIDFYREVVQGLRGWVPSAPRLPAEKATPPTVAAPVAEPSPGADVLEQPHHEHNGGEPDSSPSAPL